MWNRARALLTELAAVDTWRCVHGAELHDYRLAAPAAATQVRAAEQRLAGPLPLALRSFYAEMGNGGAGPSYGVLPAERLFGWRVGEPYPGRHALHAAALAGGALAYDDQIEVPEDLLTGLVAVIHEGCGHHAALVSFGERAGEVVWVSADGLVGEAGTAFPTLYEAWAERELAIFGKLRALVGSAATLPEIQAALREDHLVFADEHLASLAGRPRAGNPQRTSGRGRQEWGEALLRELRERRAPRARWRPTGGRGG